VRNAGHSMLLSGRCVFGVGPALFVRPGDLVNGITTRVFSGSNKPDWTSTRSGKVTFVRGFLFRYTEN
jgi:hypothetical protein